MVVNANKNPIMLNESERGIYKIAKINKSKGINKIVPGEEYKGQKKPYEMSAVTQTNVLDMEEQAKKNQATEAMRKRVKAMSANLNNGIEDINDLKNKMKNK